MNRLLPARFRSPGGTRTLAVLLTVLLVASAGCTGFFGGNDTGGGDGAPPIDSVPAGVDTVMTFESGIIDDPTTVTLMDGLIEMSGGDQTYEELLEQAESESELSRDGFNSLAVFTDAASVDESEYAGMIADTDWSWDELVAASNATGEDVADDLEEDSYNGVTVYKNQTSQVEEEAWIADLGDGAFALGSSQAVKDVIDTREGDASPFGGDLRDAYESAEDGYLKLAMLVPEDQVDDAGQQAGVSAEFVPTPEVVTMTYFTDGDTMNLDAQMTMADGEEAEQFNQVVGGALDPATDDSAGNDEDPFRILTDATDVSRDGTEVTVSVSITPEELLTVVETLTGQMGSGPAASTAVAAD